MDVSVLATATRQPACWDEPQVFANLDLDYNPDDEDYAHLDAEGHAAAAEAKRVAEEAAVDVCMGCPLMLACEEMDAKESAKPHAVFVHGVIGARTEDERLARLGRRRTAATVATPNPQIAPGDRGPRQQIDDTLVVRLTLAGRTGDEIAHELQCSVRTVTRARKRMASALMGSLQPIPTTQAANQPVAPVTPVMILKQAAAKQAATKPVTSTPAQPVTQTAPKAQPVIDHAPTKTVTQTITKPVAKPVAKAAVKAAAKPGTQQTTEKRHTFLNGSRISSVMEVVYDYLSRNPEGATFADLKNLAAAHIDPTEAMDWWLNRHSKTIDGTLVIRSSKADMTEAERIREGALLKAHNAVDAAVRAGRYLSKQGDTVTLLPDALDAWRVRMSNATAAAAA